jgi:hypothetical protein
MTPRTATTRLKLPPTVSVSDAVLRKIQSLKNSQNWKFFGHFIIIANAIIAASENSFELRGILEKHQNWRNFVENGLVVYNGIAKAQYKSKEEEEEEDEKREEEPEMSSSSDVDDDEDDGGAKYDSDWIAENWKKYVRKKSGSTGSDAQRKTVVI